MSTKHTPGKWAIRDNEIIGPYGTSKSICEMTGDFCTPEETKANKQLIASSPELLEVLIDCREWFILNHKSKKIPMEGVGAPAFLTKLNTAIQNATNP